MILFLHTHSNELATDNIRGLRSTSHYTRPMNEKIRSLDLATAANNERLVIVPMNNYLRIRMDYIDFNLKVVQKDCYFHY